MEQFVRYSMWDWDNGDYLYFEDNVPASVGGWKPLTGLGIPTGTRGGRDNIGVHIEDALPRLPADPRNAVRYIGRGHDPIGQIVQPRTPKFLIPGAQLQGPSVAYGRPMALAGLGASAATVVETVKELSQHTGLRLVFTGFSLGMTFGALFGKSKLVMAIGSILGLVAFASRVESIQREIGKLTPLQLPKPDRLQPDMPSEAPALPGIPSFAAELLPASASAPGLSGMWRPVVQLHPRVNAATKWRRR